MTEPATTYATTATIGVALLSLFPGVDAAVVMGAFSGAVVFVMASDDLALVKRAVFFVISFVAGCLAARLFATGLRAIVPERVEVSPAVGALIASAIIVRLLLWLIRRAEHPDKWLDRIKRGGQ